MVDQKIQQPGRARLRKARGPDRPTYLDPGDIDRLFIMMTSVIAEVSVLRDRLDTHEALAEAGQVATSEAVERYELAEDRRATRDRHRDEMLARVFRVIYEDREG